MPFQMIALNEALFKLRMSIIPSLGIVQTIITHVNKKGGRALLVGGAVRDLLWGLGVKDLDIEVHGLSLQQLEDMLKQYGVVRCVGKQFGVVRIDGLAIDWSVPRKDSEGRKPHVVCDPFMPLKDAFARRDLTINAMGIDLVTFEFVDPFDGLRDMKLHILRAPDKQLFVQDPLRFFRVMQFIARFESFPDQELHNLCKTMSLDGIAQERIFQEFEKMILFSVRPSLGFIWLLQVDRLKSFLPELYDTLKTEQDPLWHPEGSVFEHTMQALDAAAEGQYDDDNVRLTVLWAVLCHDLGKTLVTQHIDGRIRAHGHDVKGVALARSLLHRITNKEAPIEAVEKLVRYHMAPIQFVVQKAGDVAYKRLALKLSPQTTLAVLCKVSLADRRGRNPKKTRPLQVKTCAEIDLFLKKAQELCIVDGPEAPVLQGRDLLDILESGPRFGFALDRAYEIQIEEGIIDKEVLKARILKHFS